MPKESTGKSLSDSINVALVNLEKGLGNKDGRPKIQLFSSYMDKNNKMDVDVIPFGIQSVDDATNLGGVPRGRMVELFGPESGGKSYLSLKLIASAQKMGLVAALIDVEHSFVSSWATEHGVNADTLLYGCDFEYGEQALDYVNKMAQMGMVALIVIDSTAALAPKAEISGDIEDQHPGMLARMMSKALRQIMDSSAKTNTTVIWINQIREKVSIGRPIWGDPETTPGGRALKFYSHMRLRVARTGKIFEKNAEDEKNVVGTKSIIKVVKNKMAAPFGEGAFEIPTKKGANDPMVLLVKKAYELKAIGRKNIDDKGMIFVFGKGKDQIVTGCGDYVSLAKWFNDQNKMPELITVMKEKAEDKGVEIGDDVLDVVGGDPDTVE